MRTIAKLSGWAYSLSDKGVAVNLYGSNKLDTQLLDGSPLKLNQETGYPWDGAVKIICPLLCMEQPGHGGDDRLYAGDLGIMGVLKWLLARAFQGVRCR